MRLHGRVLTSLLLLIALVPAFAQEAASAEAAAPDIGEENRGQLILEPPEEGEPFWLLLERGRKEMEEGEFGTALYLFTKALDQRPLFPEAEMALGDVFLAEGEKELARRQYEKAVEARDALLIPDDIYALRYRMADLHRLDGDYPELERALVAVLQEDQAYYREVYLRLGDRYLGKYLEEGLDRLLELYRLERRPERRAHLELADLYYRAGEREARPVMHRLFAVVIVLSDGIAEYLNFDPLFQFRDLEEFLRLAARRESVADYFTAAGLYEQLYYLAVSTHAAGREARAREVWALLEDLEAAGRYGDLASRQLLSPWVDLPSIEL